MHDFALAMTLLSSAAAPVSPPPAPTIAFEETLFGDTVVDPYRWMEDPAKQGEVTAWLRANGEVAAARLRALPERAAFAAVLERSTRAGTNYGSVRSVGDRIFYLRTQASDRTAKLVVRERGSERVLLDPIAGADGVAAISNYSVSPDGRTVAVQVAQGGGEVGQILFVDVASGTRGAASLGPVWGEFPATWLSNDRIAYTRMAADSTAADGLQNMRVMVTRPGSADVGEAVLGPGVGDGPIFAATELPFISRTAASPLIIGVGVGARADIRVLMTDEAAPVAGKPNWREVAGYADQVSDAAALGKDIYFITTKTQSNGTLMRRRFAADGLGAAETVPTPAGLILGEVHATIGGVYVVARRDGIAHLLFLRAGGSWTRELALPHDVDVSTASVSGDARSLLFGLTSWTRAVRYYRATGDKVAALGIESDSWPGARDVEVVREEAIGADGTRVPMAIMLPRRRSGPIPTLLGGYGAYGQVITSPRYQSYFNAWPAHGGALALCGTRGGGERGRDWHEAGRGANKAVARADFIACAEHLVASGYSRAGTIAAIGTSASGGLVPGAVMERPELFAALIPRVAVLNASRLGAAENGANQFAEMGDPATAQGYAALVQQDAYRQLERARNLPDTLVTVGLNDRRVSPWMSAKFAARAQARFGARRRVLVRVDAEAGHGIGSARDRVIDEFADIYAFAWDRATATSSPTK
jgi:prolyl oligopeptidase